ncbi:MAG: sigma-54 dependent transcriptional regulator [Microscillaceae bacterium]|nr:sigma-54 dependent transcriptional regulator [Microscillaceae bacterium]
MLEDSEIQAVKRRFGIVGNSPLLNNAILRAIQVAPTEMSVLITGESGSGKESFSKIIHSLSKRKHGPFIAINCGAIPEGTIYSELFGHEKGAFTGSTDARKGYFEVTDGGTIFLDEIGEMPFDSQAMLLRILENGEYIRMGSSSPRKTDVRVVAATNVDLIQAVRDKKFREDLYFRLSTMPIFVPPLRDRGKDVELLFRKFASDFSEKYKVEPIKLSEDAKEVLGRFRFPGNIRQLRNLVEQISLIETETRVIDALKLSAYLPDDQKLLALTLPDLHHTNGDSKSFSEREILYKVLFDLKNDVTELKKLVFQLLQNGDYDAEFIRDHKDLFHNLNETDFKTPKIKSDPLLLKAPEDNIIEITSNGTSNKENTQDIQHEEQIDTLSLEEKEKELITRALKKNNNKRKYAAQDLGISERTLYRKIKQYEIDNQK